MDAVHIILLLGIALVIVYDFTNGFHDAADMIATAVASNSMKPKRAIILVSVFTFLGPFLGGIAVADTIGEFVSIKGEEATVASSVTLAALLSAITYNLITWKLSLPSSSSTSLTSGLIGAGLLALGNSHIHWGFAELMHGRLAGFVKIIVGMFLSPLTGFIVGFLLFRTMMPLLRRLTIRTRPALVGIQYLTVSWLAFSHGTNDAQKGMGILAMLLLATGVYPSFHVPVWVIFMCASAITLGTLFGGWNIIRTVGFGIYKVRLVHSIADQLGAAIIILSSSYIGAPVSTTQVVTTTLMGIGASERPKHVHWKMAISIVSGWALNIPVCIILGAAYCFLFEKIFT